MHARTADSFKGIPSKPPAIVDVVGHSITTPFVDAVADVLELVPDVLVTALDVLVEELATDLVAARDDASEAEDVVAL